MTEFTDDTGEYKDLYTGFEKINFKRLKNFALKHPDEHIINNLTNTFHTMKPITISGELYIPSYMSKSYKNSIDKIQEIDPSGVFFADLSNVTDAEESVTDIIKEAEFKNNNKYTNEDNSFPFHKRYKKVNSYNPKQIDPNDVNTFGNLILKLIELDEKGIDLERLDDNEYSKIPLFGRYNETKKIHNIFDIDNYLKNNENHLIDTSLNDLLEIFNKVFPKIPISINFPDESMNQDKKFEEKISQLKKKIEALLKKNNQQQQQQQKTEPQPEQHKPKQQLKPTTTPTSTPTSTPGGKDISFTVSFDSDAKIVKVEINNNTFGDGTYIVDPKNPKNEQEISGGEISHTIDQRLSFVYNTGDKSIKYANPESTSKPLLLRSQPQPPITEQTDDMKNILNEYLKLFDVLEKRYTDIVENTAKQNEEDVVKTVEDFSLVSHKINQVVFENISNENNKVKELKEKYLNNQQEQTLPPTPPLPPPPTTQPLPPTPPQQEQEQEQINDLKGIVNIGNSCYINATIQFLINAGNSAINAANYNKDLHSFMNNYKTNKEDPIKTGVYKLANVFNHNGSQQDASESVLIPFLQNKKKGFDTTVRITSTFKCNNKVKYDDSKSDVSNTILVLPINEDPTNLTTLIEQMSIEETLDVPTEKCQEKVPNITIKTTKTDHYYFGDYAIIALNRFIVNQSDNTTSKNDSKVSIEKILKLPIDNQSEHKYKCISMINHLGSLKVGHYWANVVKYDISDKPQMYKCNDSSITEESIPNDKYIVENSPSVYIVLYEKIKDQ
jgi:ubiquitin C-terminal hydrolase